MSAEMHRNRQKVQYEQREGSKKIAPLDPGWDEREKRMDGWMKTEMELLEQMR